MKADFFKYNRQRLMEAVPGGLIILTGYTAMQSTGDAAARFEQESNFWWLTGIDEPDWGLIIDGVHQKITLVAPALTESQLTFDGGLSAEKALLISGADTVLPSNELESTYRGLAKSHPLCYSLGTHPYSDYMTFFQNPAPKKLFDTLTRVFQSVRDCRKQLATIRSIKSAAEINAVQAAVDSTVAAFIHVKQRLDTFKTEAEVEAEFSYLFRRGGTDGHAYAPIVAGGKNACTLHYNKNNDRLRKGSLLLLDIGARREGYAADISRTVAIGTPTKRQQAVFNAVKAAQAEIISYIKPGRSIEEYYQAVDTIMKSAAVELRLITDTDDTAYRNVFPHAIGHGLGVDVHDMGGSSREFKPGMILTVEPGLYSKAESIGVRIEDDILVTNKGHTNLSRHLKVEL